MGSGVQEADFDWQAWGNDRNAEWLADYSKHSRPTGESSMKVNDVYQSTSDYLKAEDLPVGTRAGVVISKCEAQEFTNKEDNSKQRKMVLSFEGREKKLVLNITNAKMIARNLGSDDTDNWIGKRIELYRSVTDRGSQKDVPCIRVKEQVPDAVDGDVPF
jgi:hypothetical protein